MRHPDRNLIYDTMWWLQCVAHIHNFLPLCRAICIDAGNWIQYGSLSDDPLQLSAQSIGQFSHSLNNLLGPYTANLPAHSAASVQESSPS
jgi:hypothetical protein